MTQEETDNTPPSPVDISRYGIEEAKKVLDLSDEEAGQQILRLFIAVEAAKVGFAPDAIPDQLAEEIRGRIPTVEAEQFDAIPLEKAVKLASACRYEEAGRVWKLYVLKTARHMIALKNEEVGLRRRAQASDWGERGTGISKARGSRTRARVYQSARAILQKQPTLSDRALAQQVAEDIHIASETVRPHLRRLKKRLQRSREP